MVLQLLFWEILAWNLSWTAQMVLRTNYKAFWVVSSEKKFFQKFAIFRLFLHNRGHRFLEKWPTSFLRDTGLKFVGGLHKWCCERILRRFRLFRGKTIFFLRKLAIFLTFFAYPGSQISWKMTNFFFERYQPEICRGLHKWCCERILPNFRLFRAKKNFFENWQLFYFFCISGFTNFLKNG